MFKLIEKVKSDISSFLEQREKGICLVATQEEHTGYIIKIMDDIEQSGSPDVILLFPQEYTGSDAFVDLVVERIKVSVDAAYTNVTETGKTLNKNAFQIPGQCHDKKLPASQRLMDALCFARRLLDHKKGQHLVCAFLPVGIGNYPDYCRFVVETFLQKNEKPWFRGMRILLRDDSAGSLFLKNALDSPYIGQLKVDFSLEAINSSLKGEANDVSLSKEQRAQALLQVACIDYAHKRNNEALEKYFDLLAYFQETDNQLMQAVVLNSIGDVHNRMEDREVAKQWYERALVPAKDAHSPIILFTIARNLAHLMFDMKMFKESEEYFDCCQKIALLTKDPGTKITSLEWRGLSQENQVRIKSKKLSSLTQEDILYCQKAMKSYEEALQSVLEHKLDDHRERIQTHLKRVLNRFEQKELLMEAIQNGTSPQSSLEVNS